MPKLKDLAWIAFSCTLAVCMVLYQAYSTRSVGITVGTALGCFLMVALPLSVCASERDHEDKLRAMHTNIDTGMTKIYNARARDQSARSLQ